MAVAHKKPPVQQKIAKERIKVLFEQAKKRFSSEPRLSHRYVELAWKIALKYKVTLTPLQKKKMCKKCHKYLVQGSNVRVRTQEGHVVYTCLECRNIMRFPYRK